MKIRFDSRYLLAVAAVSVMAIAVACGGGDDSGELAVGDDRDGVFLEERGLVEFAGSAGLPGSPGDAESVEVQVQAARPAATAAPAAAALQAKESGDAQTVVTKGDGFGSAESTRSTTSAGSASVEKEIAAATDGRVIIRTGDYNLTVEDVARTMDDISKISISAGGWVVSSEQSRKYLGFIAIRVPAVRFDDVMEQVSDLATKVNFVTTRSDDFTEEFTDVSARVRTLRDTTDRLRELFNRADEVEDALLIQKEITRVQSDLEAFEARLNFLSNSSAFSLISVALESADIKLVIDAGADISTTVGEQVTYRVKFTPPEGIEEFSVTWDFGDGTGKQQTSRTVLTGNGEELITAPIIHSFFDNQGSPFIVTVKLEGSGEGGIARGEDKLITTVSRLPVIDLFAGENQIVEVGSEVQFSASFTRPEGVFDLSYVWNFGDGTAPIKVELGSLEGAGQITTTHVYENFRPKPYSVTLVMTGNTDVGAVEATGEVSVDVRENIGVAQSELDAGSSARNAWRVLKSIGVIIANLGIWLLILSPIWLIAGGIVFVLVRRSSKNYNATSADAPSRSEREMLDM